LAPAEEGLSLIHFRTFRNPDPPALVDVWTAACTGRGVVPLRLPTLLEYFTFAKPYFDPEGLIVAEADGVPIGFVHAGFGPKLQGTALDNHTGVTCALAVKPESRRQGVGAGLLRKSEEYLRKRGARELWAGPLPTRNPFTFGLYGGSDSAGFLASDGLARPFFEKHGYTIAASWLVWQRPLTRLQLPNDQRFARYRERFEILAAPVPPDNWYRECVLGPIELVEFRLQDKATGAVAAKLTLWEMEPFSQPWNEQAVGLVDLQIAPAMKRQGLAKFLLAQTLLHLQDQYFTLVEAHTAIENEPAARLLKMLGFAQIDTGYSYINARPR
jgi:ribosomal protein S18 acetylase RimI-like enzyme